MIIPLALVLGLVSANVAAAAPPPQPCADEEVAAIHQYCELLPDAGGILAPGSSRETLAEALPPATTKRLEKAGPKGLALLSLPVETVRPDRRAELPKLLEARMDELEGRLVRDDAAAVGVLKAIAAEATGGGLSDAFRWAFLLSTVGLGGAAWRRNQRRTHP